MTTRPSLSIPKPTHLRVSVTMLVAVVCVVLLWQQIKTINLTDVAVVFGQISVWQWIGAALATAGSFAALGHYDALWHKALRTGVPPRKAHRTGMYAVAIGQTLGLAAVTASFVRWRQFPQLSSAQIIALTATVSLSFMVCWALLLVPALWVLLADSAMARPPFAVLMVVLTVVFFAANRLALRYKVSRRIGAQLLGWTTLDLICAACVLAVLLPTHVPLTLLLPAMIVAVGAGLLSNAPGGIGAFDLTLIMLLPTVPLDTMVSTLLAYRLIYILIPFVIAAYALTKKPHIPTAAPVQAPPAWGLADQSGLIVQSKGWSALLGETALGPVAIGDPVANSSTLWIDQIGAVYKCSAKTAAKLRRNGWTTMRIAKEARLNPQTFTTNGSKRQSLRRKIRKADQDGISVTQDRAETTDMAQVAAIWAQNHNGELGFSMGRFDPAYVAQQRVFIIKQHGKLIGFMTFHENQQGWALDLIRYIPSLPCGAMQMAIVAALETAKTEGATQLCLGAVPSLTGRLSGLAAKRAGLLQFKRSFGPTWHPVYHAARNPIWFALTGIAVTWEIQRPLQNLQYNGFVIMIMRAFHLITSRARGIGRHSENGPPPDDQRPCHTDERPRLASG